MPRPVENDDFCKQMAGIEIKFSPPWQADVCTHFDHEEDECDLEACQYPSKWLNWFEYKEAL